MGAWGIKSYENDATYDCLNDYPDSMSEHQSNISIARAYNHYSKNKEECQETALLGTIVFCLENNHNVKDKRHLKEALKIAEKWIVDEKYLKDWKTAEQRKAQLATEIKMIQEALNGLCKR